ncbi:DEAD/DEAH box helicase [Halomonas sp. LS-001]
MYPSGLERDLFDFLDTNSGKCKLEDSVIYFGFPVFKGYEGESIKAQFLILSPSKGCIIFDVASSVDLDEKDEIVSDAFNFIEASFRKSKILRFNKRNLKFQVQSFLLCLGYNEEDNVDSDLISSYEDLFDFFNLLPEDENVTDEEFAEMRSIVEGAKSLARKVTRKKINDNPHSKSNILIELEKEINNFDVEQRKIAINLINGPQRIRGLAGSGKTIVLAMKAAHIHLQHPDKNILFTFYTKSLYDLIKDSISKFYRHFSNEDPNWEMINIFHAWGGKRAAGVYYNACVDNKVFPMDFSTAKSKSSDPFGFICKDIIKNEISEKYDYILIDEAQDLPSDFFKLCYRLAKGKAGKEKNIVWAYDELQSIFNIYQRAAKELFGSFENGMPYIDLESFASDLGACQSNDLVLHKCYRNPLEILVTAHALGFGIYSELPVQMLENPKHWRDVGYQVSQEEFSIGEEVTITRPLENSPMSIGKYQNKYDVVKFSSFSNINDEIENTVKIINGFIDDGVLPEDMLVICLDDTNARRYFSKISSNLLDYNIRTNNLLVSDLATPPFVLDKMVTLSTVHRAKGNEAPVVIVIGIDAIYEMRKTRKGRNRIFTAFTRSKAWLRVSGIGEHADFFGKEINESIEKSPSLVFEFPSLDAIDTIQRDLADKSNNLNKFKEQYQDLLDQGYTEEQIQMELSFAGRVKND